MARQPRKGDFPVGQIRRYLEPGPIVLVSSRWKDMTNIMTMGWHTVMEFTPSLVGCVIAGGNHSFRMIRNSGECVINLPTTRLTDAVVGIGNSSGAEVDKFREFGLTAEEAAAVAAPLIRECGVPVCGVCVAPPPTRARRSRLNIRAHTAHAHSWAATENPTRTPGLGRRIP